MIDVLLGSLEKVKAQGANRWMACCPAHDDKTPSLTIQELTDSRILVHCFAGCGGAEIMSALGLSLSDLYPDGGVAHQLMGWSQIAKKQTARSDKKTDKTLESDRIYLMLCDSKRRQGERLSNSELTKERESYLRVHA